MEINNLTYMTVAEYSAVFGQEMSHKEFLALLSKISCQKALVILSRFASLQLALCYKEKKAIDLSQQLKLIHYKHIKELGGNTVKYNEFDTLMCLQSIFLLEKWVLVYCLNDCRLTPITLEDIMTIMDAILSINDKLPKDDVHGHETEYLYLMLYHNTPKNIIHQLARSYYVFSTLAKQERETIDFLKRYEQDKKFSVTDRISVLFLSLYNVYPSFEFEDFFSKNLCAKAEGFDAVGLASVYDTIMHSLKSNHAQSQKNAKKILSQVWNFEPFYRTPFVQIDDSLYCFSAVHVVYQIWEGLYWDVRYNFHNDGELFMRNFGRPYEHYIQQITNAAASESNNKAIFQNEFLYKYKKDSRASSDCYCRIGNTLIAVEAKAKSPHSKTLAGVDRSAILIEVKDLMIDPVNQVLERYKEIYSDENDIDVKTKTFFQGVDQTIILSVSMEKVQPIGELLYEFDKDINPQLAGTKVVAYHNVNIEEYEAICNLIQTAPDELPQILIEWFKAQRKDKRSAVVLANYLISCKKPYVCSKYVSDLFNKSINDIMEKTFPDS